MDYHTYNAISVVITVILLEIATTQEESIQGEEGEQLDDQWEEDQSTVALRQEDRYTTTGI